MINNIFQLAEALEVPEDRVSQIGRLIFKSTECGCVFNEVPDGVTVCGYAEGADAECIPHELSYPFTIAEFYVELGKADLEGCELYEAWHKDEIEYSSRKTNDGSTG